MTTLVVEALLFGGAPDPQFHLNATASLAAHKILTTERRCRTFAIGTRVLGFSGWRLTGSHETVRGLPKFDELIFGLSEFRALPEGVRDHITQEAMKISKMGCNNDHIDQPVVEEAPSSSYSYVEKDCTSDAPIRGPDDPTRVHYDPSHDDDGCFVTEQYKNNCYNYGNDVATNSFAQPGRGSGVCSHHTRPCVPNTCADVRRGAESDGLVWVGTDLPTSLPSVGHYVSLHIWPKSNFHWIRMDANLTWSHKPGGSPVRNHDNDGKVITDPGKSNFSPWTQHCGYMLSMPSNVSLY